MKYLLCHSALWATLLPSITALPYSLGKRDDQRAACGSEEYYDEDKQACTVCPMGTTPNGFGWCQCINPYTMPNLFAPTVGVCGCIEFFIPGPKYSYTCLKQCFNNQIRNPSDGWACIDCPANSAPNGDHTVCNCQEGFTMNAGGACEPTPVNCSPTQIKVGNTCQDCPGNSTPVNNVCTTPAGCPANAVKDKVTKQCVCKNGYTMNDANTVCNLNCGPNARWATGKNSCLCAPGFYKLDPVTNDCIKQPDCGEGGRFNVNQESCVCESSYYKDTITNKCKPIPSCQPNATFNIKQAQCQCNDNYYMDNNVCIAYPDCGLGGRFNPTSRKCVCQTNWYLDTTTQTCKEKPQCGDHANFSPSKQTCVCESHYYMSGSDCIAIPDCPLNATFKVNAVPPACKCDAGFTLTGNECTPRRP